MVVSFKTKLSVSTRLSACTLETGHGACLGTGPETVHLPGGSLLPSPYSWLLGVRFPVRTLSPPTFPGLTGAHSCLRRPKPWRPTGTWTGLLRLLSGRRPEDWPNSQSSLVSGHRT